MACPFLIVKEDGRYNYKYYCKARGGAYLGDSNDKRQVENVCRSYHERCDAYKHPRT